MTKQTNERHPSGLLKRVIARCRTAAAIALLGVAPVVAASAQRPVTVSGFVTASGVPVRGASVSISDLDVSATSNDEGRYSFIVPASQVRGQTVLISARHRRYSTRTMPVALTGGSLQLDFEMQALTPRVALETETGGAIPAGATKAPAASVAATQPVDVIDGSTLLESVGQTSVARELAGRIPGLVVTSATTQGGSARVTIRGPHSLFADDQPLFVVDGLPIDNSSFASRAQQTGEGGFDFGSSEQDLNPQDVASIHVLKGPGAAALFGGRAVNGAIVITTRNGRDLNGLAISASQQFTLDSPLRFPKFQNSYGQGLGGQFKFVNGRGGGVNDSVSQSWGPALDGQPIAQFSASEAARPDVRFWQAHPDNVRDFFSSGRSLTTNVAVYGSSERTMARLSLSNQDESGTVPNSYYTRKTAALALTRSFSEQLRVAVNAQGIDGRALNRPGTGEDGANPMFGLTQMGRQVDLATLEAHRVDATGKQINWNYTSQNNPYFAAFENGNSDDRQRAIGQAAVMFDLTRWLTASTRLGTDFYHGNRDFRVASGWMSGYEDYAGRGDFSNGGFQNQKVYAQQTNADLSVLARLRQDRDLRFDVTLGANARRDAARIQSLSSDELVTPGVYEIGNSAKAALSSQAATAARTNAAYGALNVALRDIASLSIGERAERSSVLAADRDRYLNSSVSGSFAFTRALPAMRLGGVLTDGRLRAQWARASDASFAFASLSEPATSFGAVPRASVGDALTNSSLAPETTSSWEVGTSLQSKVGVNLDLAYYSERRADQLLVLSLPASSGFTRTVVNGGELTNTGFEAQINAPLLRSTSGLAWDVAGTYARNNNRVRSLYSGAESLPLGPSLWGLSIEAREGQPLGVLVGHRYLRETGSNALLLRDGHPLPDTVSGNEVLGSTLPAWTAGITNTLRYKTLELSVLVDLRWGGKIFSATNLLGDYSGVLAETAFRPDTGLLVDGIDVATGKANTTHISTENYYHSLLPIQERWVYDASYARLREARLTLTLSPRLAIFSRGGAARVSLIGRNLFLWSRAPNIDPETTLSTSSFQGAELGQLPATRSIGVQLTVTP